MVTGWLVHTLPAPNVDQQKILLVDMEASPDLIPLLVVVRLGKFRHIKRLHFVSFLETNCWDYLKETQRSANWKQKTAVCLLNSA